MNKKTMALVAVGLGGFAAYKTFTNPDIGFTTKTAPIAAVGIPVMALLLARTMGAA